MPVYSYKAVSSGGKSIRGALVADSDRHARQLLRDSGVTPVLLAEKAAGRRRAPALDWLATTTRQLGTLVKAGLPLDIALSSLATASTDPAMRTLLVSIHEGVVKGQSLSASIRKSWGGRPDGGQDLGELAAMVEAGEASGDLAEVLSHYADMLERRLLFRRRLRGALFYPLLVVALATGVVVFLFAYVVPTITRLFEDSSMPLPLPTRVLISVSDFVQLGFWPAAIAAVLLLLFGRSWFGTLSWRRRFERWSLKMPMLGQILEKAALARWARTVGSLLSGGVEILEALDISSRTAQSIRIEEAMAQVRPRVAGGVPLPKALLESGTFPALAIEAVTVGEQSGELARILLGMAQSWEAEVESSAERFADLLEPLVLVIMGGLVGGIVLAILLPIFEFNSTVR